MMIKMSIRLKHPTITKKTHKKTYFSTVTQDAGAVQPKSRPREEVKHDKRTLQGQNPHQVSQKGPDLGHEGLDRSQNRWQVGTI